MLTNIIYVLATVSLFIGSLLTFKKEVPDFFYLIGTSLFLLKALLNLFGEVREKKKKDSYL